MHLPLRYAQSRSVPRSVCQGARPWLTGCVYRGACAFYMIALHTQACARQGQCTYGNAHPDMHGHLGERTQGALQGLRALEVEHVQGCPLSQQIE